MHFKTPLIVRNDYIISLEPDGQGEWFVHADIFNWNGRIRKQLMLEWEMLRVLYAGRPFYAVHRPSEHSDPERHKKFLSLFGFKHLRDDVYPNGEPVKVYWCIDSRYLEA